MRTNISIILFLFFTINLSYSQDNKYKSDKNNNKINAFFGKGDAKAFIKNLNISGAYGGPILKYGYMNDSWVTMWGGQGAVVFNKTFGVGLKGVGTFRHKFENSDKETRYLTMGYGGPYLEYINNIGSLVHLSSHLGILLGGARIKDSKDKNASSLVRDFYFVLEPGVNLEVNLATFLILALNLEYRFTIGPDLSKDITISKLSGFNAGISLKFGKF